MLHRLHTSVFFQKFQSVKSHFLTISCYTYVVVYYYLCNTWVVFLPMSAYHLVHCYCSIALHVSACFFKHVNDFIEADGSILCV